MNREIRERERATRADSRDSLYVAVSFILTHIIITYTHTHNTHSLLSHTLLPAKSAGRHIHRTTWIPSLNPPGRYLHTHTYISSHLQIHSINVCMYFVSIDCNLIYTP